ncbi:hypothetical protein PAXRUDRAFT_822692 [Paxillus rubicundulus Ve08.2h10]|uniref:Heterokaryon incompatibility domain-containing protein n=1 Tax=Paxillus rubicundulus Ve08.2h10 TaxID=930991 RepID=A0A0D0ECK5_9AGAM|nr:hypothetical protein PAXRUDRAFT_822692 [Paxillus rubicundulus Ve08.2h10]
MKDIPRSQFPLTSTPSPSIIIQPETDEELSFSIRQLYLDHFDAYVFNRLPTYLIHISDMKLVSRSEVWENIRPRVKPSNRTLEEARRIKEQRGVQQDVLKIHCLKYIDDLLKYAILSHRWGVGEPEFRDMSSKIHRERPVPAGLGYKKLLKFCEKARDDYGCAYAWSDTCCINKESSAELAEAVLSMYRWYRDAHICIVHLAGSSSVKDFPNEPWFTRGWTLQELLAPKRLRFFGKDWVPIRPKGEAQENSSFHRPDDKSSPFMLNAISEAADIGLDHLKNFNLNPNSVAVSEKMRWASNRKTTRVEDVAYCLLGIFDISIPIAYGEGGRSFYRLLEAIAQRCIDPTFFAWVGEPSIYSHALPASPAGYGSKETAGVVAKIKSLASRYPIGDSGYTITKLGLRVKLLVVPAEQSGGDWSHCHLTTTDKAFPQTIRVSGFPNLKFAHGHTLAIVDYNRIDATRGMLRAGEHHFCLFLSECKEWDGDVPIMYKRSTDNLLTFHSAVDFTQELTTVCLSHHDTTLCLHN